MMLQDADGVHLCNVTDTIMDRIFFCKQYVSCLKGWFELFRKAGNYFILCFFVQVVNRMHV